MSSLVNISKVCCSAAYFCFCVSKSTHFNIIRITQKDKLWEPIDAESEFAEWKVAILRSQCLCKQESGYDFKLGISRNILGGSRNRISKKRKFWKWAGLVFWGCGAAARCSEIRKINAALVPCSISNTHTALHFQPIRWKFQKTFRLKRKK